MIENIIKIFASLVPLKDFISFPPKIIQLIKRYRAARIESKIINSKNNQNLYKFISLIYEKEKILSYKNITFPAVIYEVSDKQRYDLESILGELDLDSEDQIDKEYEKYGEKYLKYLKRIGTKIWDGKTYKLKKIKKEDEIKMECQVGSYFNMLKSCDALEYELYLNFDKVEKKGIIKLPLRSRLISKGEIINQLSGRSPAISISVLIIYRENDNFRTFIRKRSREVGADKDIMHIVPSFMFQPVSGWIKEEYSIRHNIYREYLEELFNKTELVYHSGEYGYDYFYEDDNLKYLIELEKKGDAKFMLSGISIDLLKLRPEIMTVLLINNPEWIYNQSRGKKLKKFKLGVLRINWEFDNISLYKNKKYGGIISLNLGKDLNIPEDILMPNILSPFSAAAIITGLEIAKSELKKNKK